MTPVSVQVLLCFQILPEDSEHKHKGSEDFCLDGSAHLKKAGLWLLHTHAQKDARKHMEEPGFPGL